MEISFQEVVKEYRQAQKLTVRGFAEALTEKLVNVTVSGQTISRWEKDPNRAPDLYLFLNCVTTYTDWRMAFAVDALKAILPHVFNDIVVFHLPGAITNEVPKR